MSLWQCTNPDCGTLTGPDPLRSAFCPRCGSATAFFNSQAAATMPRASTSITADPPSPVPSLREILTEAILGRLYVHVLNVGEQGDPTGNVVRDYLIEQIGPAWDARERRIVDLEADKDTQPEWYQIEADKHLARAAEAERKAAFWEASCDAAHDSWQIDRDKLREAEAAREGLRQQGKKLVDWLHTVKVSTTSGEWKASSFDVFLEFEKLLSPTPKKD